MDEVTELSAFHYTGDGSPFGGALCGFKPAEGEGVWVTQIRTDVSCAVCLDLMTVAK